MKLKNFPGVLALPLLTVMLGCTTTGPATVADDEDEYEGRLFSWEFEIDSDQPLTEQQPSSDSPPSSKSSSQTSAPPAAKKTIRVRRSTEDDESGDRGFIIHSGDSSSYEED